MFRGWPAGPRQWRHHRAVTGADRGTRTYRRHGRTPGRCDSQGCLTAAEAKPFYVRAPPSGRNLPNSNNETPETKKPADWRVFPSRADQLLDLGFLVDHMLAHDRIVLLQDRKSTRLNSSHVKTSYAVFC